MCKPINGPDRLCKLLRAVKKLRLWSNILNSALAQIGKHLYNMTFRFFQTEAMSEKMLGREGKVL